MSYNTRVSSEMANEIASEIFDFEAQHCPLVEKHCGAALSGVLTRSVSLFCSEIFDFEAQHCPLVEKGMQVERPRKPRGLCDSGLQLRVSGYVRKKVENRDGLKTISLSSDATRFLFYKRDSGSTSTFESARFSGWFISTARNVDRVRVAMCNGRASAGRVTDFQVSRI
ncbi:UNVERIFIED_CONTAM: hypothetical protein FKN15_035597 [Acipenser sinensis]